MKMAVKQNKSQSQVVVKCDICGKEVYPTCAQTPTDYVWHSGTKICNECLATGKYRSVTGD